MNIHPIANIPPRMPDEDYQALKADIAANGLLVPIVLYESMILDGVHRYRACQETGVPVRTTEYTGTDPVGFVRSHNKFRRHLNTSQLSMWAARESEYYEAQAKERQAAAGGDHGNQHTGGKEAVMEKLPQPPKGTARDQAGKAFGVSGKSVDAAKKVLTSGIKELQAAVDNKEISVHKAKEIATLPESVQADALKEAKAKKKTRSKTAKKAAKPVETETPADKHPVLSGVLYGIERARDAIERLEKPDHEIAVQFVDELNAADEYNKQRWNDCYDTLRLLEKIMRASEVRASRLRVVSGD